MSNIIDRDKDKLQETYDRMLVEKATYKYMGKANDSMADFLEELEESVPDNKDAKSKLRYKEFRKIDSKWDDLWNIITTLISKI